MEIKTSGQIYELIRLAMRAGEPEVENEKWVAVDDIIGLKDHEWNLPLLRKTLLELKD